jgi:P-type Cu+ transporter
MEMWKTTAIAATVMLVHAVAGVGCKRADSARGADDRKARQGEVAAETDPVCGMAVPPGAAVATRVHQGHTYYFCAEGCAQDFDKAPSRYAASGSSPRTGQ